MGNLTDDMTRLRGEVDALRSERGVMMQGLACGAKELATTVSAMQADFAVARIAMAKQTRGEREAFVAKVTAEVNSLLGDFSRDRGTMARKGRDDRGIFLAEMGREVTSILKATSDDLLGARIAWRGQIFRKAQTDQQMRQPEIEAPAAQVEETENMTAVESEFEQEKPLDTFREPLEIEEIITASTSPEATEVEPSDINTEHPAFDDTEDMKQIEENRMDESPYNVATKGKRGKK